MKSLAILLLFGLSQSQSCFVVKEPLPPNSYHILGFGGQSNTMGTGVIESQDSNTYAMLWNDLGWEPAVGKLNRHSDNGAGNGGLSWVNECGKILAANAPRGHGIALVVNAQAGSSITAWANNGLMIKTVHRMLAARASDPRNKITGYMHQSGETDKDSMWTWRPNAMKLRHIMDSMGLYDLPIFFGGINPAYTAANDTIKAVAADIRNAHFVSTHGLRAPDWLHFPSADSRILGDRFAQAYKVVVF